MAPMRILLLGGTSEGRQLARDLSTLPGVEITSSLAGRVRSPEQVPGEVRIGGFGGVNGLIAHLFAENVDLVIDATHPFAAEMTHNAAKACSITGTPLIRVDRPAWTRLPGDTWHEVDTVAEAARLADRVGSRLFVTTGRQEAQEFAGVSAWCLMRSVEAPDPPLPAHHEILLAKGPFVVPEEIALMRDRGIDCLVTKNSGGGATIAKMWAARELGVPVVLVRRPPLPHGLACVPDPEAAVDWVARRLGHASRR
ncbi:cobalt-precorrin-6A reductase [Mobilicoccus sp.]|uniref:cobalt-precorrin-6A reductase n=1 Tax=Mobilicoccus sp. TaxID=2034349 RepID=UPI0028B18B55|nr:cobalt-precorrin-6A reductase [Mobilicoccus sp.]